MIQHKNIVKKSPSLFLQIKYVTTGICVTPVSDNTLWSPSSPIYFKSRPTEELFNMC